MSLNMLILGDREEWLEARAGRIGGSDASAILGMNPYRTNIELWQIKTGRLIPEDISDKPYVKYGTEAEQHLRKLFELDFPEYEMRYVENNMFINDDYPFAHASLDGWLTEKDTGRTGVWECKTTNILQSMQKEKWNHRIPDNYYIQLLHYLLVTGWDFAVLKAQLKYEFDGEVYLQTKHYRIERSEVEEDIKQLEAAERTFWKQVQERKRPALILPEI
ncbi:putative phage-type endonuclease [uncultured Clostridium sp.]|nr:putative phage-type endonuclease [uncultured Clostridium sp.]